MVKILKNNYCSKRSLRSTKWLNLPILVKICGKMKELLYNYQKNERITRNMDKLGRNNPLNFDIYERRILAELQINARLTNQELAERVSLSPSACWRRVKGLEEAGVIMRYTAILDPTKIGFGETVFAQITLARHSEELTREFTEEICAHPKVMDCYHTSGNADLLLRVATSGVSDYDRFLEENILKAKGIAQVRSNFALRQLKSKTALPIPLD